MKQRRFALRITLLCLALVVGSLCVAGTILLARARSIARDPGSVLLAQPTAIARDAREAVPREGARDGAREESVLPLVLLGLDSNRERAAQYKGYRTDTMVVCAIRVDDPSVVAITIPRDTKADMNILDAKGDVVDTTAFRINSAFNYGYGRNARAYDNCLNALEGLFAQSGRQVALQHYVGVDMDAIGPLSEAVGGVPVTLTLDMPGVGKAGEIVTLRGEAAETYVRTRKGEGMSGSDLERTRRQQTFFQSMAAQVKRMGVAALPGLCASVSQHIDTDLSLEQLVAMASVLNNLEEESIAFYSLEGKTGKENGSDLFFADANAMSALLGYAFFGEAAPAATS